MSELSAKDRADLESIGIDPDAPDEAQPVSRTVLEVWASVLENIEVSRESYPAPDTAARILRAWPHLKVTDLAAYHELYHGFLLEFREVISTVIEEHPEALKHTGVDADTGISHDAAENGELYIEVLLGLQLVAQGLSLGWDCRNTGAGAELAALGDAQDFYLGDKGLVQHLGAIGFSPSQEQYEAMAAALDEQKAGR